MGLFNKVLFGNPNKPDLVIDENQKPVTMFFEVLSIKFWELIKVNLLFTIFMLPTAIWLIINLNALTIEGTSRVTVDSIVFTFVVGLIPCLIIAGIALPSLNYITKSYANETHVWLLQDFLGKIKENWKQSLMYCLILSLGIFISYMGIRVYTVIIEIIPAAGILRYILYVIVVIIAISAMYAYPLMVSVKLKLKHIIRNSLLLTVGKLPQTLLMILCVVIIPIALYFLSTVWAYGMYVIIGYYVLFGFSFSAFIINSFTNQIFKSIGLSIEENSHENNENDEGK